MNIWHPSSCPNFCPRIVDYGYKGSARPKCAACGTMGPASTPRCTPSDLPGPWEHRFPATSPAYPSIRLLRLEYTTHEDIIQGTFEVVHLSTPNNKVPTPKFDAVSYTWADEMGDSSVKHFVYLGPQWYALPVTASCFNVLKRVRELVAVAWIDSICIDQASNADRAEQVSLMSFIYSEARRVLAFIRPCVSHSKDAIKVATTEDFQRFSLQRLIHEKYFHRVWVIQELLLGRDVLMIFGKYQFWYQHLKGFVNRWYAEAPDIPCPLRLLPPCNGPENLLDLLVASRSSKATDTRDKIYALLGIVSSLSGRPISIEPDYRRTTASLFCEVAASVVSYRGTEILEHTDCVLQRVCCQLCGLQGYARGCSCEQKDCPCCKESVDHTHSRCCCQCFTHVLPRWVPNWTIDPHTAIQPTLFLMAEANLFFIQAHLQHDIWLSNSRRMQPYVDLEGNLHGEGIFLDIVTATEGNSIYFQYAGTLESSEYGLLHQGDSLWLFPKVSTPVIVSSRAFWFATVRSYGGKLPQRRLHVGAAVEGTFLGKCAIRVGKGSGMDDRTTLNNGDLLVSYAAYARRGLVKLDCQSSFLDSEI